MGKDENTSQQPELGPTFPLRSKAGRSSWALSPVFEKLNIGDRIEVGGGYDMEPGWLNGKQHYSGTVRKFIPGQNETSAAVIELDEKISFQEVTGKTLILELRYVGANWKDKETVHVEVCDFEPEEKAWQDRKRGKWVESHASYKKIKSGI